MPRKWVAMRTINIVQIHWNPETKKTGDSSNAGVCLYRPLKLLTDDQVSLTQNILYCLV